MAVKFPCGLSEGTQLFVAEFLMFGRRYWIQDPHARMTKSRSLSRSSVDIYEALPWSDPSSPSKGFGTLKL